MAMSMELIDRIRDGVIGDRRGIQTPFGTKPLIYADYTASGRSLDFIEDFIRQQVLPRYANTHSESSYSGCANDCVARAGSRYYPQGGWWQ
jgi:selenocysteine lyase/cysteine desulfurase